MTREERLQAAAEALRREADSGQDWWDCWTDAQIVAFVHDALFPELAGGTHWIAPNELPDHASEIVDSSRYGRDIAIHHLWDDLREACLKSPAAQS